MKKRAFAISLAVSVWMAVAPAVAMDSMLEQMILKGYALRQKGDFTGSEAAYKEAIEYAKKQSGENSVDYASAIAMLAGLYSASEREKEAETLWLQEIGILEKTDVKEAKPLLMATYDNLSGLYARQHRETEALELNDKAMKFFSDGANVSVAEAEHMAKVLNNRAAIYLNMGKAQEAADTWSRAIDLMKAPENEKSRAIMTDNLAEAYEKLGQNEKAYDIRKSALQMMISSYGPQHPEVAKCLGNLAVIATQLNHLTEAASYREQAIEILRKTLPAGHPLLLNALAAQSLLLRQMGKNDEAAAIDKEVGGGTAAAIAAIAAGQPTGQGLGSADLHIFKAIAADKAGNWKEAMTEAKAGLADQTLKDKAGLIIANQVVSHAAMELGNLPEAEKAARESVRLAGEQLGTDSPKYADALNTLGLLQLSAGKWADAEQTLEKAIAIDEKAVGKDSPKLTVEQFNLATAYHSHGKLQPAEELYKHILAVREKEFGTSDPRTMKVANNLAALYGEQGKYDQQIALMQQQIETIEKKAAPDITDRSNLSIAYNNLGTAYEKQEKWAEAEKAISKSAELTEKDSGPNSVQMATVLSNMGSIYQHQKKWATARSSLLKALSIKEKVLGPNAADLAPTLNNLAVLYCNEQNYPQAEACVKRAMAIQSKTSDPNSAHMASLLNIVGEIQFKAGKLAAAEASYKQAIGLVEKNFGPNHPDLAVLLMNEAHVVAAEHRPADAKALIARAIAVKAKTAPKK